MTNSQEIAQTLALGDIRVNYHDVGSGRPVVLLHGSGAGVSAWANWRLSIPVLAEFRRVIAPDLVGFGYTQIPDDYKFIHMQSWIDQIIDMLDALNIQQADFVGNSFGASLILALVVKHPDRVGRMVLMGSGGQPFKVSPELSRLWGYKPSLEAMREILQVMAFDQSIVTEELADMRYQATLKDGSQSRFERIFPEPHQRWADALVIDDDDLAALEHETLLLHGREDRVVPVHVSEDLFKKIKNSQLHLFGSCGHWTQIEQAERFNHLVKSFLQEIQ